jgi:hypothetical protein
LAERRVRFDTFVDYWPAVRDGAGVAIIASRYSDGA